MSISGADPLNLAGILTPGPRLAALTGNRLLYRDGIPIALLAGGEVRFLTELEPREEWEAQRTLFGPDPWEYGLTPANVHNLETLIGYAHGQGLIPRRMRVDELFTNPTAGAKRDGIFRY